MPAGSKALYAGSFILRLPCRASRGDPGLINNYASSALSFSLSLSYLLASLLLFLLCLSLSLSFSLRFSSFPWFQPHFRSLYFFFHLDPLHPFSILRFPPASFASSSPPVTGAVKANLQQRVRGRKLGRMKIKSELICHERPSAFFIHRGLSDGLTPTALIRPSD